MLMLVQEWQVGPVDVGLSVLHPLLRQVTLTEQILRYLHRGSNRYSFLPQEVGMRQLGTFLHLLPNVFVLPIARYTLVLSVSLAL